ncbi:hypothetical protein EG68_05785 [Paragonimus skrjabini miyazakii]|uniref:Ig-like domain-containing protein n=1 Tax=Paragonimus skrjabini miyazakii TaxID=59628 RepID=A0A8S9YUV7_9TREM|nr:hypothetical protein EG68_05785 [Paragonimus skrjabini miyazakii]
MMQSTFVWLLFLLFIIETQAQATDSAEEELEDPRPSEAPPFDPHRDNFTLAGLASKTWEGPYYQEAMLGSIVYVPCSLKPEMSHRLYKQRQLAAEEKYFWSLLWVHQNWDNVVDPWLGDGRRSYDTLQVVPYWEPDMSAHLEQARLTILDANPTDNGVYACTVAMYPLEKGLSPVILSQSDLVSVHFVRIKSAHTTGPECKNEDAEENVYCQTGFEPFTHHVYYPSGSKKGDVLFQAECNADIFLTALSLGGVDPTFWSIGWRFVPQHTLDDTRAVEMDAKLEMQFENPVHLCHPGAIVPCVSTSETDREQPKIGARDLALAQKQSVKLWKARWLVLTGTKQQTSGRWQCWVQGLGMTTHPKTLSIPVRWFIDELHIKIIPEKDLYSWWTTVEFWRVLGLVTAPSVFLLFGLIMAVGRTAAYLHPDKIPPKKRIKLLLETPSEAQSMLDAKDDMKEEFEPYAYLHAYLNRQGVESYLIGDRGRTSKMLFR